MTQFGYTFTNGKFYDAISGAQNDYVASIHTHQNPLNNKNINIGFSYEDVDFFSRNIPNKPYLSMEQNNTVSAGINNKPIIGLDKPSLQRALDGFGLTNKLKK